jgi:mannosylglycerate hydrolase
MRAVIVSHTHWDREWYRTFQAFRARLVDAVDRVLELCAADPAYRFVLDGQSIVLEDYLEVRPGRRADLERFVRAGQLAIGPWYVQPDSLLPSGEAHVRNLLEGRRVAETIGPASRVGYTPDSFGHPAQFPQLYRGCGLDAFVYWRGNGDELDELQAEYRWESPDGSDIVACHLGRGYFAAAFLPEAPERAAVQLERLAERLAERASSGQVLLMNGVDHQLPDAHVGEAARALEKATGWTVERGLLEDFVRGVDGELASWRGELCGGRIANLLPGVWSTRTYLKLRNRACETALEGWAEPWSALARELGLCDERPALRLAWRELLRNQAHDSICGCSQDRVHEQMLGRYDAAEELAQETTRRALERIAGLPAARQTPWSDELDLAVFNPSAWPRSDVVRFRVDPEPAIRPDAEDLTRTAIHPLLRATFGEPGFTIDGEPARVVASSESGRYRLIEKFPALDVEWIARDVPAFGWKRVRLRAAQPCPDVADAGREIAAGDVRVRAGDDGTFEVELGGARFRGLCAVEDTGDRGDTYDFDPVGPDLGVDVESVEVTRTRHPSGIEQLRVARRLRLPARLSADRSARSDETVALDLVCEARVAPGVERVDLRVELENRAEDHRLRLLFPTGAPVASFVAASTFDAMQRTPGPRPAHGWIHPAPATFPHQGWIAANGLMVVAPGLPEGEVLGDGTIAVTLLRAVGWLSRLSLETRPQPAGPSVPTPGAQCPGRLEARLALCPGLDPSAARDAELGLACVLAGDAPRARAGEPLLELEPRELCLSALKPAERGDGLIVRVLNPTDRPLQAHLRCGFDVGDAVVVQLDETPVEAREGGVGRVREVRVKRGRPEDGRVEQTGRELRLVVPPRALRSLCLRGSG